MKKPKRGAATMLWRLAKGVAYGGCLLAFQAGVGWAFESGPMANWSTSTRLIVAPILVLVIGAAFFTLAFTALTSGDHVRSATIRQGPADAWPPASFAMQDRFSRLGFEQFGSMEVAFPDHMAVFAAMLSPDGRTMAIISPLHLTFVSDFDGKLLSTASQATGAPNSYELRQSKRHGSPEELWDIHQSGLATAATEGLTPTTFTAVTALPALLHIEEHGLVDFSSWRQVKYMVTKGLTAGRTRALAANRRASSLIAAWRDSPHRWQPAN